MHTAFSPFALAFWKGSSPVWRKQFGWQGTSPEFGDIRVVYPAGPYSRQGIVAAVEGGLIPTATFETRGWHVDEIVKPTLNGATLRVGDEVVRMSRNRCAQTHRGRSLRMTHLGDAYTLTAINRRAYTLSRHPGADDPGVVVTVRQSGRGSSRTMTVLAAGPVLPVDVCLAALFCGVDRSVLTRRGVVRAGFARFFNFWIDSHH